MSEDIAIEVERIFTQWQREALARIRQRMAEQQKGEAFHAG